MDDAPPDWVAQQVDITCPMCAYNLRGLSDPRCPECGFAFRWAELLDGGRDHHPWLFEHARLRRVRSFAITYIITSMPRRFWRQVTPANPVRLWALLLYWVLTSLLLATVTVIPIARIGMDIAKINGMARSCYAPMPSRPGHYTGLPMHWTPALTATRAGPASRPATNILAPFSAAEVRAAAPPVASIGFVRQIAIVALGDGDFSPVFYVHVGGSRIPLGWQALAIIVSWPWVSLLALLLLFRSSMRLAKVSPLHVARAVVYSSDFGLLAWAIAGVLFGLPLLFNASPWLSQIHVWPFASSANSVVFATALCVVVTTYRLSIAYGRYLRFDHPVPTVIASQVIVLLLVLILLKQTHQLF